MQRWSLDARTQPPEDYERILLGLLRARILRPTGWMQSGARQYPTMQIVGDGVTTYKGGLEED